MRSTKTSNRVPSYVNRAVKSSRRASLKDSCEGIYEEFVRNNNKLPCDMWLILSVLVVVDFAKVLQSFRSDLNNVSSTKTNSYTNIRRPAESDEAEKREKTNQLIEAKNEDARTYTAVLSDKEKEKNWEGNFWTTINGVKVKSGIKDHISPNTI